MACASAQQTAVRLDVADFVNALENGRITWSASPIIPGLRQSPAHPHQEIKNSIVPLIEAGGNAILLSSQSQHRLLRWEKNVFTALLLAERI